MPKLLPKLREVNDAPTEALLEHMRKMDAFGSIRYVGDKR